jgi:hypothetical protein
MQNAVGRIKGLLRQLLSQKWAKLSREHPTVDQGEKPGAYLLAFAQKNLERQKINLCDVFYVGMSNARRGVNGRLKQFVNAIEGKSDKHAAGKRFFKEWCNGTPYSQLACNKQFYVTGITVPCQVEKGKRAPEDLRKMGEVAALEYYVLAAIKGEPSSEPRLNRK